jgi:uncharacterized lipoprotein YmbA
MMTRFLAARLAAVVLAVGLSACGSAPPAPVDHFYRLQTSASLPMVDIGRIQATSLYAERPIVYSEASNPRQLRQYHYHLWLYPPAQMIREVLSTSAAPQPDGKARPLLDARIVSFDRIVAAGGSSARVVLDVTLGAGSTATTTRRYQAESVAGDASITAFVVAMEAALGQVVAEIQRDLATLSPR